MSYQLLLITRDSETLQPEALTLEDAYSAASVLVRRRAVAIVNSETGDRLSVNEARELLARTEDLCD